MRESELIWKGIPVSPGITHAKTYHYKASNVVIEEGYFETLQSTKDKKTKDRKRRQQDGTKRNQNGLSRG